MAEAKILCELLASPSHPAGCPRQSHIFVRRVRHVSFFPKFGLHPRGFASKFTWKNPSHEV